jgi:CheY-like chemotaxis protein
LGMPETDGYDLSKKLRSRRAEDGGDIPAIALTGFAGSEEAERALKAGYQTLLTTLRILFSSLPLLEVY